MDTRKMTQRYYETRFSTPNGVSFEEDYTSNGVYFTLLKAKGITNEAIKEAKRYLKHNRDALGFDVVKVEIVED